VCLRSLHVISAHGGGLCSCSPRLLACGRFRQLPQTSLSKKIRYCIKLLDGGINQIIAK
jgi:hypothetical protein